MWIERENVQLVEVGVPQVSVLGYDSLEDLFRVGLAQYL